MICLSAKKYLTINRRLHGVPKGYFGHEVDWKPICAMIFLGFSLRWVHYTLDGFIWMTSQRVDLLKYLNLLCFLSYWHCQQRAKRYLWLPQSQIQSSSRLSLNEPLINAYLWIKISELETGWLILVRSGNLVTYGQNTFTNVLLLQWMHVTVPLSIISGQLMLGHISVKGKNQFPWISTIFDADESCDSEIANIFKFKTSVVTLRQRQVAVFNTYRCTNKWCSIMSAYIHAHEANKCCSKFGNC